MKLVKVEHRTENLLSISRVTLDMTLDDFHTLMGALSHAILSTQKELTTVHELNRKIVEVMLQEQLETQELFSALYKLRLKS